MKFFVAFAIMSCHMISAQHWIDDLEEARRIAAASNKMVLLYFAVSESCESCRALEEKVFRSDEFKDFADTRFVLARPEFRAHEPIETKAEKLMIVEKYNKDGFFPLVVILDRNLKVLGKTGAYDGEPPAEYIRKLKNSSHE